ncbi:peptidoglycan-recognition protein LF-like [Macrosteles quadrilineatus]|uniref:peptidoglycan-recognition protein LF-like n=1 Tax=Macrosteles quadrilineatus TaxID=74068 RepID=UPI0023E13D17|nr:peptidoglycan-recognition protein LF-like [Macrosteles quadrilineatus]
MPVYTGTLPDQTFELMDRIVNRDKWRAEPMMRKGLRLHTPVLNVLMTYTNTDPCYTLGECSKAMMDLQLYHVRYHIRDDIPYNFVLGGDNRIYCGRTWQWVVPMPEEFRRKHRDTIVIARIGRPQEDPKQQEKDFLAGHDLCEWAEELGLLTKGYNVRMIPNDWNVYENEDPD